MIKDDIVNNILFFFFFLILINHNLEILNTDYAYIGVFILILALVLNLFKFTLYKSTISYLVLLSLFSWLYGLILGFINSNPLEAILRNFAGISFYSFFFILKINKNTYKKMINFIAYSAVALMLILLPKINFFALNSFIFNSNSLFMEVGSSAIRSLWSSHLSLIICLNSLTVFFILKPNFTSNSIKILNLIKYFKFFLYFLTLIVIFKSGSKGFWLAYFFCNVILIFSALINIKWFSLIRVFSLSMIFIYTLYYFYNEISEILKNLIYLELNVYTNRLEQFDELYNEITFFGKGLGGFLNSGYSRDTLNYGFELTVMNIFHKLGIFSLPLLLIFILPILICIYNLFTFKNYFNSLISLNLISFSIPGLFNPLLYSPINVVLHVLSIFILFPNFYNFNHFNHNRSLNYET